MLSKTEPALSFGLQNIDHVFPGLKGDNFIVLHGHPFCKTLIFLLSVRCQLPKEDGGFNSSAIYLDSGNTFNPYAISAIAQEYGLDPKSVLEQIIVSRAFTAYQLSALIFETLEDALKQYRSKLVVISDITSLFLDRDVPITEANEIFKKAMIYLSKLATKRNVILVASCFPVSHLKRRTFLYTLLFRSASTVINVKEFKDRLQFKLESHSILKPFTVGIFSNAVTLEKFVKA